MKSGVLPVAPPADRSDSELLYAVRNELRSVYDDVLKQPIPRRIAAVLLRLAEAERRDAAPSGAADPVRGDCKRLARERPGTHIPRDVRRVRDRAGGGAL
jgi:hypothetical protein